MSTHTDRIKVIIICGPTGIGKTSATIGMARAFNGEIISADSMQIYKYMDIGTAKPTPEERAAVPHHLVDFVAPDAPFDAARFAALGREKISELAGRGITPFVAGGTGLYIRALICGIFQADPPDARIREKLRREAKELGSAALHDRLILRDPGAAARIHPNDTFRIVRALEICEATGKTLSEYHQAHRFADAPFDVLKIGLHMEREALYDRINRRVDAMLEAGLREEVEGLINRGYSPELRPMQSLGYRHMADFIEGRLTWEEAAETLKRDTRRYAKRQMTWFRADPEIVWKRPDEILSAFPLVKNFLQDSSGCFNIDGMDQAECGKPE
ncbi:tRNA (adenosine(37)-N6)-dimethylallyltransferase MiaA [Desulfonema ishimotonii]|uniref:tRNA dimethylallyltransferase n=1 Tax=Desulfonema ishimotonii TaxID=45657 RepID=A0A401G0N3_9BACT|nr:tRNA (adenosine(37)-N6)-dimethylallyltransferase MiaA [Desulfonema ishimotonii]GBC62785.1 tRNA (adenosine(37)-N6)-dimethylallyltransferase MiaA [Desulfonema ishimotonii]